MTASVGEFGSVTTTRGIDRSGSFTIVFADRMDAKSQDSLYALIEPMDIIEIRMARSPGRDVPLTLVMRGVVSNIERPESAGGDGRVSRVVHVSGHDFGKFLQIMQISYQKEYAYGQ